MGGSVLQQQGRCRWAVRRRARAPLPDPSAASGYLLFLEWCLARAAPAALIAPVMGRSDPVMDNTPGPAAPETHRLERCVVDRNCAADGPDVGTPVVGDLARAVVVRVPAGDFDGRRGTAGNVQRAAIVDYRDELLGRAEHLDGQQPGTVQGERGAGFNDDVLAQQVAAVGLPDERLGCEGQQVVHRVVLGAGGQDQRVARSGGHAVGNVEAGSLSSGQSSAWVRTWTRRWSSLATRAASLVGLPV